MDSLRLYGLNSKRRLNTRQAVGCGIPSSLLALPVHLRGPHSKFSSIRLTFSSDTRGRPELLPLHGQSTCSNWWFQRQMLFLLGGWMLKPRRNARCTAVVDSVLMNSRTQKNLVLHSSHFALNWRCRTALGERSSGGIWKFRTSSFKCYVDHSHTMYSSGNIDVRNWVSLFESRCIIKFLSYLNWRPSGNSTFRLGTQDEGNYYQKE